MSLDIKVSNTPNENALKFTVNQILMDSGHKTYDDPKQAGDSPLARKLLEIDGVASVFLIQDFITVTKQPEVKWVELKGKILEGIKATL